MIRNRPNGEGCAKPCIHNGLSICSIKDGVINKVRTVAIITRPVFQFIFSVFPKFRYFPFTRPVFQFFSVRSRKFCIFLYRKKPRNTEISGKYLKKKKKQSSLRSTLSKAWFRSYWVCSLLLREPIRLFRFLLLFCIPFIMG